MTTDTGTPVTREAQIVYLTEWAARCSRSCAASYHNKRRSRRGVA